MNGPLAGIPLKRLKPGRVGPQGVVAALRGLRLLALATLSMLVTLQAVAAAAPAPGNAYRLAGVMRVGDDRIGFLEVPAGGQMLVRLGSNVDGGRITVFSDRELRISFPDRNVVLELTGGVGTPAGTSTLGVVTGQDDNMDVMVRNVDRHRLTEALEQTRPATGGAATKAARSDPQGEVGRRFAAVAGLPLGARVVAVNDQPVVSAQKAIAAVEMSLAEGQPATLNLESAPGGPPNRVYLLPNQD
jgi:hypothetical protein